MNILHI